MSDLEGLARSLLKRNKTDEEILNRLVQEYMDFKDITKDLFRSIGENEFFSTYYDINDLLLELK